MPKSKFQDIKFRSLDEFFEYIREDERQLVQYLRNIILDCLPNCIEKLSYNVPYYRKNKAICFLWPASVKWGKKETFKGVRLGFANGNLMSDEIHFLERGQRKQVYWKDFTSIKEIDVDLLKSYIFEAAFIDEQFGKKSN